MVKRERIISGEKFYGERRTEVRNEIVVLSDIVYANMSGVKRKNEKRIGRKEGDRINDDRL